jgi:hypothetical protein
MMSQKDPVWIADQIGTRTICFQLLEHDPENRIPPIGSKPEGKLFRIIL